MYDLTVSSERFGQFRTMKAFGASELLYGTPMTATSSICGWVRRIPSSSAGETCQPRTAIWLTKLVHGGKLEKGLPLIRS